MKETIKMSRAVGQLEKMYNVINQEKFGGELPTPIITVQSKPGTWGHCSVSKIWKRKDDETFEMNIAAESMNGIIEEIIDTLIHEMIHLYCRIHDIQETSRGGTYHNKKFKKLAEEKGLKVVDAGNYGWNTSGKDNEALTEYALEHNWSELMIRRQITGFRIPIAGSGTAQSGAPTQGTKAPSSTRKYKCPCCGNSVRATKAVNIICGDCMKQMELA